MKNLILLSLVAFFSFGISNAVVKDNPKAYAIKGTVSDTSLNGQTVKMSDYNNTQQAPLETIVTNGTFTFKGTVDTIGIRRISLGRLYANIILEGGNIALAMEPRGKTSVAHGTPLNETLAAFVTKGEALWSVARQARQDIYKDSTLSKDEQNQRWEQTSQEMQKPFIQTSTDLFNANKNNPVGAFILWNNNDLYTDDQFEALLATAGDVVKNYGPLKKIVERNTNLKNTAVGKPFIDFDAKKTDNTTPAKFSDYIGKGKWVLVDFWASWCGPCREEMPNLKTIHEKYGNDIVILGMNVWDKPEKCTTAMQELGITWDVIMSDTEVPTTLYGINGIPHIILFAPDGTIAARNLRGEAIDTTLKEKLNK